MTIDFFFFFFSSRRRHTRYWRDWSSDVCSSDLRGLDYSGSNGVNVNPQGGQLSSETFCHRNYPRLGCTVQGVPESASSSHRRDGGDVDDLSILFFDHERQDSLRAVKHTGQVNFGDFLPILNGRVHYRARFQDTCVVDQDVDTPINIDNSPNHLFDLLRIPNVQLSREGLSAFLLQVLLNLLS